MAHSTPEEFTSRRMVVERMDIFDLLEVSEIFASLIETIPNEKCFAFGAARIQHQLIMENVLPRQVSYCNVGYNLILNYVTLFNRICYTPQKAVWRAYNQPHPSLHSNSEIENA